MVASFASIPRPRATGSVALSASVGSAVRLSIVHVTGGCRERANDKGGLAVERWTSNLYA